MNKTKIIFGGLAAFFLSACSLGFSGNDGGVFRSDDGGKSFAPKNAAEGGKTISGTDILSIAFNLQNGQEIYIGTKTSGILKSEDGGELWKPVKVFDFTPTKIYSLAIDAADSRNVYAVSVVNKRGKIIRSSDAGASWKEIYTEPADGSLVLSLAIDPKNSQKIFAGTDKGQIIFSEDAGVTWRSLLWTQNNKAVYQIAFDSLDSNTIYFLIFQDSVIRTTDGGNSFQELVRAKNNAEFSFGAENLQKPVSIKTDPTRTGWVYVGTADGLLRSKDKGENWEIVKTLNKTDEFDVVSIDINPTNSDEMIFGAAKTFYKSVDGGINWMPVQSQTTRTLQVVKYNPQNPEVIWIGMNKR